MPLQIPTANPKESGVMASMTSPIRRLFLAGGFAVAIAAAPAVAFLAVPSAGSAPAVTACPSGETEDVYTDLCVPHLTPNTPGGISYSTPGDPYSVPEVQGIPCTGRNTGECIGLEEDAQTPVVPHSELSSSP
jgi:hypothetical protein